MSKDFLVGCTYNFTQPQDRVTPLERFQKVRDTGAFDYINWLPPRPLIDACIKASEQTRIPMTTGNCGLQLGRDEDRLGALLEDAGRVDMKLLNVMLNTYAADGHELTDVEITDAYKKGMDLGARHGVEVSFEVHVDCWTESYKRVTPFVKALRAENIKVNVTLDYSHVVFKIANPAEQRISGIEEDVAAGRIVLDPFMPGSLCEEWLALDVISFAQFRPVSPHNPRNVWARNEDGSMPRGIMYPITRPGEGEWHSPWHAFELATCKEAFRHVLRYHLSHKTSPLKYVITEMIARADYGLNAKFSLLEHNAECARWIRKEWAYLKKLHAAGMPLQA